VSAELSPKANPMDAFQCVSLAQHARAGAIAHGICFAIHVVYFYPVLLQRSILLRLQPLLDNAAARRPIAD